LHYSDILDNCFTIKKWESIYQESNLCRRTVS